MADLQAKYLTEGGQAAALGSPARLFGVQISKNQASDDCTVSFRDGGAMGSPLLIFQLGESDGIEPFMFSVPGGNSIRYDDGIFVLFGGGSNNPLSVTVLFQGGTV